MFAVLGKKLEAANNVVYHKIDSSSLFYRQFPSLSFEPLTKIIDY